MVNEGSSTQRLSINPNTRSLTFQCNNLGTETHLMLTFAPPRDGDLYVDEFPLCWKVIHLPATGISSATVVYTANTVYLVPQVITGDLVTASNAQLCSTGQKCTVITVDNANVVTPPMAGTAGFLECFNDTASKANIGIGFYDDAATQVTPALLWTDVAVDYAVKVQFTPTLRIYNTYDYQESQVVRGAIQSPMIWKKNLEELAQVSTFVVTIDPSTGEVVIGGPQ